VGGIKSLPGAHSQYEGHSGKFCSDYHQSVEDLAPRFRPVSIIVRWIESIQFHVAT
jgi:hypothetical protein